MFAVVLVIIIFLPFAIIRSIEIGPIFYVLGTMTLLVGGFFSIPTGKQKNWKPLLMVLLISVVFLILGACSREVYIRDFF